MLYVYKSMPNRLRNDLVFVLTILMIGSLFISRALLTVTMIAFVAHSILHKDWKAQLKHFLSTPVLTGMTILFFIPLLSGGWSEDHSQWMDIVRIKLPLLLMPLAFAGPYWPSARQWRLSGWVFIILILISTIWTITQYLPESAAINAAYLESKTMITPLENDHVRYSFLLSAGFLISVFLILKERPGKFKIFAALIAIWFVACIHLLAARTGLLCFYITLIALAVGYTIHKRKKWVMVLMAVLLLVMPFLSYRLIPSFHNRVDFFKYEMGYFKNSDYLTGGSDAVRVISIKGGWELMNQQPLTGTGFGDLKKAMNAWYEKHYAAMKKEEMIYPAAEWLVYGAGAGWPGLILFVAAVMIPFFARVKNRFWFVVINLVSIASLLFDIGLEVQFGVFIYAFVILWSWKWFNAENA